MSKFLLHTLFLFSAVVLAFFWTSSPTLSPYTLQLIALFILLFMINQIILRRSQSHAFSRSSRFVFTIDALIFTSVIMLLIYSTGGLTSPLFFLIYFLMFGLALFFEPPITLSLTAIIALLFFLTPSSQNFLTEVLQLFSLFLITPLALFFSTQYLKFLESEKKIKILQEELKITEEQIAQTETATLLWTTLDFKREISGIIEEVNNLLADISHLTPSQKEKLSKIRQKALSLLKSGEYLKEKVDKTTDE